MATLLHFLRSLAVSLLMGFLAGFVMTVTGLGMVLMSLVGLQASPLATLTEPICTPVSQFLSVFGRGDRIEGIIAIALAIGLVATLLQGFRRYKDSQRSTWQLAASGHSFGQR